MSSTNRGARRIENDHYRTPASAYEPLYAHILWDRVENITDPCAGDGRLLDAAPGNVPMFGTELLAEPAYPKHCSVRYGVDYLRPHGKLERHLGITNPPFSKADMVLGRMLEDFESVILLQRVNWLGAQHRASFWSTYLPKLTHLLVLGKRPSFVNSCHECGRLQHPEDGAECFVCRTPVRRATDSVEYAWFCWDFQRVLDLPPGVGRLD